MGDCYRNRILEDNIELMMQYSVYIIAICLYLLVAVIDVYKTIIKLCINKKLIYDRFMCKIFQLRRSDKGAKTAKFKTLKGLNRVQSSDRQTSIAGDLPVIGGAEQQFLRNRKNNNNMAFE